jgi:hypothetical protein
MQGRAWPASNEAEKFSPVAFAPDFQGRLRYQGRTMRIMADGGGRCDSPLSSGATAPPIYISDGTGIAEQETMAKPRQRVRLEDGLKLDLNRLIRRGFARRPGFMVGTVRWTYPYADHETANGLVTVSIQDFRRGWLRMQLGELDQKIWLHSQPRHFGGRQWYFVCPRTNTLTSVLWKPSGASQFRSRRACGRRAAYASQFKTPYDRAVSAAQRLRCQLAGPEWIALDGSDPPKPKWMRWRTYDRIIGRANAYEAIADRYLWGLVARLGK